MLVRKYMYVCVFVVKRSTLIANYVYHLISLPSRVAATSYTIVEMQLPFLVLWGRPVSHCSVGGERTASPETTSGRLCFAIASVGNNRYASQTHKTGHSYDCYIIQ